MNDINDYYVAGRKSGTLKVSLSLVSTIIGASAGIGLAGHFYNFGFAGIWWILSGSIGLLFLALFFVDRIKINQNYTLPELLGKHYGKEVRIFSGLCISLSWLGIISAQILAAGYLINFFFPALNIKISFIIIGLIFLLYTSLGGQKAIIKTDVIQFVLLSLSFIILFIISYNHNVFINLFLTIPKNITTDKFNLLKVIEMLIIVGFPYLIGPDIYSRIFSSNSSKTAKNSLIISSFIILLIGIIIFFIVGFYLQIMESTIEHSDKILYEVVNYYISSVYLKLIVILGLLSLIMSSADTCLLSSGSIIIYDVISPLFPKNNLLKNNLVIFTKFAIVIIGILSIIIALFSSGIIRNLFVSYKFYTVALGAPGLFMLIFSSIKLGKKIIIISIILSCFTLVVTEFILKISGAGLISLGVSFLILSFYIFYTKTIGLCD